MPTIKKINGHIVVRGMDISQSVQLMLDSGQEYAVDIKLRDSRKMTDQQRKFIFALCENFADYTGYDSEVMRAYFMEKNRRLNECEKDSLTEYNQTDASKLIDIIIDDTFEQGITIGNLAQEYKHNISARQTYAMALQRVCCICGRKGADIHHFDQIGTKGNRDKISHIGMRALPLCRLHHTEIHNQNRDEFIAKYHITPFEIDKKMEFFIKNGQLKDFK